MAKKTNEQPSLQIHKPEAPDLRLVVPGAILYGQKCTECGGFLVVPQRGPTPETCSAKCRVAKFRRLRKEAKATKD